MSTLKLVRDQALGDFPPVYSAWAASVKALGGAAVVWPSNVAPAGNAGKPAARFSSATLTALVAAGKVAPTAAAVSPSGYAYVLAPAAVVAAAPALANVTEQEAAGLEQTLWQRWGFPDLGKLGKVAAIAGGVIVAGWLLYHFAPRRRNPPRRRRFKRQARRRARR